jgi:hypothetical protein
LSVWIRQDIFLPVAAVESAALALLERVIVRSRVNAIAELDEFRDRRALENLVGEPFTDIREMDPVGRTQIVQIRIQDLLVCPPSAGPESGSAAETSVAEQAVERVRQRLIGWRQRRGVRRRNRRLELAEEFSRFLGDQCVCRRLERLGEIRFGTDQGGAPGRIVLIVAERQGSEGPPSQAIRTQVILSAVSWSDGLPIMPGLASVRAMPRSLQASGSATGARQREHAPIS